MDILSKGYRFRRGTGSPFDYQANPSVDLSVARNGIPCQWCRHCQMSVDTRSESYNQHQVWGQKHWCKRCGHVTASAVYYQVQDVDKPATPLHDKAVQWAIESESKG
jgi:hypothetical protein